MTRVFENDELSEFRAQWKQEIETEKGKSNDEDALDLYRQALYYEREGQPFEAVRYYRRAFKLNPELEHSKQAQLEADFLSPETVQFQPASKNQKVSQNLKQVSFIHFFSIC